jgi:hypothetical protein
MQTYSIGGGNGMFIKEISETQLTKMLVIFVQQLSSGPGAFQVGLVFGMSCGCRTMYVVLVYHTFYM